MYKVERLLEEALEDIDIPDSMKERAFARYKSVGEWLCRPDSTLKDYSPNVYPQGSFNLGTAVKPISDEDDYDVDSVCEVSHLRSAWTQEQLKDKLGVELDLYTKSNGMNNLPEEGKRCWTLVYADSGHGFHFDVLPCLPKDYGFSTNISITDKNHPSYEYICDDWEESNPKGYLEWFRSRMEIRFGVERLKLAESMQMHVDEIPKYKVKTPLQKVVQLLKRHRDIYFVNKDHKPISIIITTLAGHAYGNQEESLIASLQTIASSMDHFIRKISINHYEISNPSNPKENFAEKWKHNPKLAEAFFDWIGALKEDVNNLFQAKTDTQLTLALLPFVGTKTVNNSVIASEVIKSGLFNQAWRQVRHEPISPKIKRITITAKCKKDGFRESLFYSGQSIEKGLSLSFTANEKFRGGKYHWQIMNTGAEAIRNGQTRGAFYDGQKKSGRVREEQTSYRGNHMVQCYVIKDGIIIAQSNEFVVNIS